jgi:hypothetical protein
MTRSTLSSLAPREIESLLSALRHAEDRHDLTRRTGCAGVSTATLAADNRRWEAIGVAITDLARLIGDQFAASAFANARPETLRLAMRMSEAIDDLMDEPAWTVIDAATRLAATEAG